MVEEQDSGFKLYSLGIVTETKVRGTDKIKVTPIERLSMSNGLLNDQQVDKDVKVSDARGIKKSDKASSDIYVVAKWIPGSEANRQSSPDVVAGETVLIYKYADTQDYHWCTVFREPSIRRLETVLYGFCNLPSGTKSFDKDSSYWLEWSTHDKYVHLHTAKNDGEPFAYDVKIDTGNGILSIDDNGGDRIELDSKAGKLTITTNQKVEVNTQTAVVNAGVNVDVNTPTVNVNADSVVNITTPTTNISDNVNIGGNVVIGKAVTVGLGISTGAGGDGSSKIGGNIEGAGNIKLDGAVNASSASFTGGVNAGGAIHGSNI